MKPVVRILVLAGTLEARILCRELSRLERVEVIASLAGATKKPRDYLVKMRVGGFGGSGGLALFLQERQISLMIDATHPFAETISKNACKAAETTSTRFIRLERPPWEPRNGANWTIVGDLAEAIHAIPKDKSVLAALGTGVVKNSEKRELFEMRPDVKFVLRTLETVDTVTSPNVSIHRVQLPFTKGGELKYLADSGVDCLLCRNSGGTGGEHKLYAACELGLPVYMIDRPATRKCSTLESTFSIVNELVDWISIQTLRMASGEN